MKSFYRGVLDQIGPRSPRGSVRLMLNGHPAVVVAGRGRVESFGEVVERHRRLLKKRHHALAAEVHVPTGQARHWWDDVVRCVPRSGREVARQLARLCREDSQVTVPLRSLADAVGRTDKAGRHLAFTQTGVGVLVASGWLRIETNGAGPESVSTYYLLPGDRWVEWYPDDEEEWRQVKEDRE